MDESCRKERLGPMKRVRTMHSFNLRQNYLIFLVVLAALVVNVKSTVRTTKGYSWVVRIEKNGSFVCGGTLLNRRKILTVSGCINERQLEEYKLVFGYQRGDVATDLIKRIKGSEDDNLTFITSIGNVDGNIKLLPKVANEVNIEKVVRTCVITGFDDSGNPDVQTVDVLTSTNCSAENYLCFTAENSSSCIAKKGSAIQCFVNRRWTLYGLLEKEEICNSNTYPSAMSISPYRREIKGESIQELKCGNGKIVCSDMKTCARLCDGVSTCDDGIDELYCGPKCSQNELICPDKLSCALPCNGTSECTGGEDELGCGPNCQGNDTFICQVGNVSCAVLCDGVEQCSDGSDENNCAGPKCSPNELICPDRLACALPCNGMSECTGGEDELGCGQNCQGNETVICKIGNVTCAVPCDGVEQCSDGSDEYNCAGGDGYQICENCQKIGKRCDGNNDCTTNCESLTDEESCDTFPFICPNDGVLCDDRAGCATLCDCNDDCSIPKDEVACECESGYSTTNWVEITGYHFAGSKIVDNFSGTVSECKAKCLSTGGCLSFTYEISANNCDLFDETVYDNPTQFSIWSDFNFYQRRCAQC